ncbi:MAG: NAD-dependent epimerase/dehydratase family protein [Hydrococcus sp. Prado102]|jgi:UDP-glucose 4-epimerase|nr:NAD-dependent epimerase/dehydratase family protein [Hydrococcus sp. Prado102]
MSDQLTLLITGVAGFIGRYVARYFSDKGWSVIGIDNSPPENAPLANLSTYYRLQLPTAELSDILQKSPPYACIHCAGRASVGLSLSDPGSDFYASTALTFEILNALRLNAPQCRFVFLSSAAVYGNPHSLPVSEEQPPAPLSPYGFHKWQCEQLCWEFAKVYQLSATSLRIFSAYGPGLRRQVIWDICQKALARNSLILQGTGRESRDFIHAIDIANALSIVVDKAPMQGEVYNLGTGREVAIAQLTDLVLQSLDLDIRPQFDGIVPSGNPANWQADISKLEQLGFFPTVPLERGIKTFANWCRAELIGI